MLQFARNVLATFGLGVLCLVVVSAAVSGQGAAAPAEKQNGPTVPSLDALDKQALALAVEAGKTANAACSALDSYKHFENARAFVNAQIKAKYPGYALDWQTQRLEAVKK